MYHKASEWKAKRAVMVGTALSTEVTLWGFLEKQLTGKTEKFSGQVSPGKEAIRDLIYRNQPVLILMDEVLEYATKAAGVKVGQSTLAAQTVAFIQELTEAVANVERACVVVTLPSSIIERYDESAEKLYQQIQKVSGRIEKIYTPVQENEITKIIRRRLFSNLSEQQAKEIVGMFMSYAEREGILPSGVEPSEYRDQFLDSYPFMPEVVNVLYQRWGSFPNFQRTRGVLRLLSLVIYSLKESSQNYISLADFDLANQEIRQELLKHIGSEFNGIIAADITDRDSGAKKVDISLGSAYQGLKLGTRAATTIFLYSFSGGQIHGATISEIKRSATTLGNPQAL
jgi:predicted AAA+ superfamily ATPase